jgi:hypothetical protein
LGTINRQIESKVVPAKESIYIGGAISVKHWVVILPKYGSAYPPIKETPVLEVGKESRWMVLRSALNESTLIIWV